MSAPVSPPMFEPRSSGFIRLSEVVSALSFALDLTEGQPMGHAVRSCLLGMRLGEHLQLSAQELSDLYYALLLKDAGCSTNASRMCQILGSDDIQAKREVKFEDWTKPSLSGLRYLMRNVLPGRSLTQKFMRAAVVGINQKRNNAEMIGARCERGATIARQIGMTSATAGAIHALDEHWNGGGYPDHLQGEQIPLLARILNISQTVEAFASARGPAAAIASVRERSSSWFDPELVRIVGHLEHDESLWNLMMSNSVREHVLAMEPGAALAASPERIDSICNAFAEVIDAKSPYTYSHSVGVARAAVEIAEGLALDPVTITMVRRAALLHDIGKLSVSNAILEKPGKLDEEEWEVMKMHPVYTRSILRLISGFDHLAFVAGAHHERLDGKGYPDGLTSPDLPLPARILCVADIYQALTENRPYRGSLPTEIVFKMMGNDVGTRIDSECFRALKSKKQGTPARVAAAGGA